VSVNYSECGNDPSETRFHRASIKGVGMTKKYNSNNSREKIPP
jgi:hypothetical protein